MTVRPRFASASQPRYAPGFREAGKTESAFTAAQRRRLRALHLDPATIDKLAAEVVMVKTGKLLLGPVAADLAYTVKRIHATLVHAKSVLASAHLHARCLIDRQLSEHVRIGFGSDKHVRQLEAALAKLVTAAGAAAAERGKGGRPRDDAARYLHYGVAEVLGVAGVESIEVLRAAFDLCLEAAGEPEDAVGRYTERERKRAARKRKNPPS